jgi:hypothetical protein
MVAGSSPLLGTTTILSWMETTGLPRDHEKDTKHKYGIDRHVRKSQRMVGFCGSSALYMYVVM